MNNRLSLTVLVDNTSLTDHNYCGEAGLSFLLETAEKKILFDTGLSGLFLANAEMMGIGLQDLNYVVLSHGHIDHTGGLPALARHLGYEAPGGKIPRVPLVAHTRCFWQKKMDGRLNGSRITEEKARQLFILTQSDRPLWITDDLVFLGKIPRNPAFGQEDPGKRLIRYPDGTWEPDRLLDDSAVAFRSREGLVIITGCSHAGICNIVEYAREVCRETRVIDIIGGLHLLATDHLRIKKTGKYLQDLHLKDLHACHCTSLMAKIGLATYCPIQEVGVGTKMAW